MTYAVKPALGVAGAIALLSGCAVFSPQQTDYDYPPSDGANSSHGDLRLRGVVLVANEEGAPGNLVGQLVNSGSSDIEVSLGFEGGDPVQSVVPAGGSASLGKDSEARLEKVPTGPGSMAKMVVSTAAAGTGVIEIPVLPSYQYYADYQPSGGPSYTPPAEPQEGEGQ